MKNFFIKQSTINISLYYIRAIIDAINMLWLFPSILTTEQIGLHKVILSSVYLVTYFTQLGLPQSVLKFFPKYQKKEKKEFLGFILVISTLIYLIFFVLFYFIKNYLIFITKKKIFIINEYFYLVFGTAYFLFMMMIIKSWYKSHLLTTYPTFIQNILMFILVSLTGALYYLKIFSFNMLLYSLFYIYFLGFFLMIFYLYKIDKLKISFKFGQFFKKNFLYEFLTYNFFSIIGNNGFSVVTKIDALMISYMIGLRENGVYAIIIALVKLIEVPRKAIKQLSMPIFSIMLNKQKHAKIDIIYKEISLIQFLVAQLIIIIIFSNIEFILNIIPNDEIKSTGKYIIFFFCASKLTDSVLNTGNDIILMSKYYWTNIIFIVSLCFLTFLTNLIFIPKYGIIGASFATSISYFIYNFITFLFIYFKMRYNPFSINLIKISISGILVYCFSIFLPALENDVLNIIIRIIFIVMAYILALYLFNISAKFSELRRDKLKNFQ